MGRTAQIVSLLHPQHPSKNVLFFAIKYVISINTRCKNYAEFSYSLQRRVRWQRRGRGDRRQQHRRLSRHHDRPARGPCARRSPRRRGHDQAVRTIRGHKGLDNLKASNPDEPHPSHLDGGPHH